MSDWNARGEAMIRTRSFSARSNGVNERLVRATTSDRLMFRKDWKPVASVENGSVVSIEESFRGMSMCI